MREIVFAGFGGQGVLTSGLIISEIAVNKGEKATWIPSYGSAMRGGTANCTVKYGNETIYNPAQEEPDLLLAMNEPSFQMFIKMVAPGGIVLISDIVNCDTSVRDDVRIVKVPSTAIAQQLENPKGANVIMTGAIVKLLGDFTKEEALTGMKNMFEKKGKDKFAVANIKAFEAGYNAV